MNFFGWMDKDWENLNKELAATKNSLAKLQQNYRIVYQALLKAELERNAARDQLETCKETIESQRGAIAGMEAQIADLRIRIEQAVSPTATSDLMMKENPAILKLKTEPQETVYQTGFGIYIGTKKSWYEFETPTVPVHLGGVAWPSIQDKGQFRQGMTAIEVFNQALKIVQEKYGYETDQDLYGPYDSWAPPIMTHLFRNGDCEDLTQFVVNIFLTYEQVYGAFQDYYCAIGAGYLGNLCHAFPILIRISSTAQTEHYIGEATLSYYAPAKTFQQLKDSYKISLGVIGHPTVKNSTGGFVVRQDAQFWKNTGTPGQEAPGAGEPEKPQERRVNGHKEEKQEILKGIWRR